MPAQRTDEQIADEIIAAFARDLSSPAGWMASRRAVAAALARAREAGAEAMRERAATVAERPEDRDEDFMRRRPDDARDADQRDAGRQLAARDIRALPLTEVIPNGK